MTHFEKKYAQEKRVDQNTRSIIIIKANLRWKYVSLSVSHLNAQLDNYFFYRRKPKSFHIICLCVIIFVLQKIAKYYNLYEQYRITVISAYVCSCIFT